MQIMNRQQAPSPTQPTTTKKIISLDSSKGGARPALMSFFGKPKTKQPVVRKGSDDELLRKNRRTVDHYLRRVGALMRKEVSLNDNGMCFFSYRKFVVVVEVPIDNNNRMFIYTMVCKLSSGDNQVAVMKRAMELNYMEHATRGSTLGLDREEVNLCYSTPIQGLTFPDLKATMEAFIVTATEVNEQLDKIKSFRGRGQSLP